MANKIDETIFQYLIHLMDNDENKDIYEFLIYSDIYADLDYSSSWSGAIKLTIVTHPEIFKKHRKLLQFFNNTIKKEFYNFTGALVTNIINRPDLNKFQLLNNRYSSIVTPWEEINKYQNELIEQLRKANEVIHFQNIGNTARTIMQKISNIVFDPSIHKAPENIDVSEGKFKNRLHTYIKTELGGSENSEIRNYAISTIDAAEKAIDIANKLTHELNANKFIAESCVISTISAINIINSIYKKE